MAQGMQSTYLMNEGGGNTLYDLSGNNNNGTLGTGVSFSSQLGGSLKFTGAGYVNPPNTITFPLTITFEVSCYSLAATLDTFFSINGNNGVACYVNATPAIVISGKAVGSSTSWPPIIDTKYVITCVATKTYYHLYVDGVYQLNDPPTDLGTAYPLVIGSDHTFWSGSFLRGYISYMYIWNRPLTSSEIQSLYLDPYQVFRPSMPYWFWSSDVATITGTLAGSLDRLTGDLDGTITVTGTISGELDRFTGAWTGIYGKTDIQLSGELDRLTGSFSGVCQVNAALAGALGRLTGDFSGVITVTGTLGGSLDRLSGELRGFYGSYGRRGLYIEIGLC
jgi:hypothetical protein